MRNLLIKTVLFSLVLITFACNTTHKKHSVTIAISKAVPEADYAHYPQWLRFGDSTVFYKDMYHLSYDSALIVFRGCDGLLLTGGTDVYPGRYGKEYDTARCWKPDFKRDSLEFLLIREAIQSNKPVMGICRGLQVLNVYFGGSLIIDIPADLDTIVKHQMTNYEDCFHDVSLVKGTLLEEISGINHGITNCNHHQGIDILSDSLVGMAYTNDGLIEAIGYKNSENKSFLLGVQWHPERMDYSNPLSGPIAVRFLQEANNYANKLKP